MIVSDRSTNDATWLLLVGISRVTKSETLRTQHH